MMDDVKQFYKFYKVYKKGRLKMEKVKRFINEHYKEMLVAGAIIFAYNRGFKQGCRATDNAVTRLITETYKTSGGK